MNGRKISGILVERGHQVVIGVGLNLARSRAEFDAAGLPGAASLAGESGRAVGAREAAEAVLAALDAWEPTPGRLAGLEAAWVTKLGLLGREAAAELADGSALGGRVRAVGFGGIAFAGGPAVGLELVRRVRVGQDGTPERRNLTMSQRPSDSPPRDQLGGRIVPPMSGSRPR